MYGLDALGRIASRTLAGLPDPHGNLALALDAAEATTVSALRYDGYGGTIASGSGGGTAVGSGLWRYQGRLDLSPAGLATPLYEFSAREYSPGLGAFTRLDSVLGDATDPLSLHRYLYAHANPATLIDPSGHAPMPCNVDQYDGCPGASYPVDDDGNAVHDEDVRQAPPPGSGGGGGGGGGSTPSPGSGDAPVYRTPDLVRADMYAHSPMSSVPTIGLAADARRAACSPANPNRARDCADYDPSGVGGFVHTSLDVFGIIPLAGAVPDGLNGLLYLAEGDLAMAGLSAGAAIPFLGDGVGATKVGARVLDAVAGAIGLGARKADELAAIAARKGDEFLPPSCARHSFAAGTLVRTADGEAEPIAGLDVGDEVSALDPASGVTARYAVSATFVHDDAVTGTVEIDGEPIGTTPGHPFLTVGRGWVEAENLEPGDLVPSVDGGAGVVGTIRWDGGPATMYDLSVETVHTFAVGTCGWVVHNCDFVDLSRPDRRRHILDGDPDGLGGGHRSGAGYGKSEFPSGWTDDEVMHHISEVATDPRFRWVAQANGRIRIEGSSGGVPITVILNPGRNYDIWTAYPR